MKKLEELKAQLQKLLTDARDISAIAEKDGDRDLTAEEREQIKAMLTDAKTVKDQIKELQGDRDMVAEMDALGEGIEILAEKEQKNPLLDAITSLKGKTVGQQFVESDEYQAFMAQFPKDENGNRRIPGKARVESLPVGFKNLVTGGSDTSGGAVVQTDYTGIYEGLGFRPFTLRDIISVRQTTSDQVEYVRQTSRTNNAAPVPEATTSGGVPDSDPDNTAGVKPESDLALVKETANVVTIAHWIASTRRAISDAAQLRGLIDQELRDGLREEEEDQIINGSGDGDDFEGIDSVSGTQNQQWTTDILTTTRKARTKVRVVGRAQATAYLMHPNDWETIDLLQDAEERYHFGGPMQLGTPRLWGLPVVESEACTEGLGWVGDFRKCVLWDREQASVTVSDSHADFFIRNMVAILAEERAAFGVTRPSALVEIALKSNVSA